MTPLAPLASVDATTAEKLGEENGRSPARLRDRTVPLVLDRVSKWFGTVIGLNQVSVEVESGIVALLGPNGAGKSTMMKLITGQIRPNLGRVRVFGRSVRSPAARRKLGYCPDVDAFYEEMTGREFVEAMLRLSGYTTRETRERAERALATVGMEDAARQRRSSKRLKGCSKGMRQRIKLAQAIAHDPRLLILDEPLSGLDPVGRKEFNDLFERLAADGTTILISSHILEDVERIADRVILIGQGRVLTQGAWDHIEDFLNEQVQQIFLASDRIRELVARLIQFPEVLEIKVTGEREAVLATRDPGYLCDRISQLVRSEGFLVERMRMHSPWASTLFTLAGGQGGG